MSAVLPGKPQSRLQGLASTRWNGININAYISGNAFTILDGSRTIIQTIYDEDETHLDAISIDEGSGKIATCTSTEVRVYKPFGIQEHAIKWALESTFDLPDRGHGAQGVLSWGSFEELLVAGASLALYSTKGQPACTWNESLPNAVKMASLTYDSAYVASIGYHDRLVKVWRRLTYGAGEIRFELSYLRQPDIVSNIRWRRPFHIEQAAENVLYTFCLDGCLRIWTASDLSEGLQWKLWGAIDIGRSLQGVDLIRDAWLACIIDGRDFTASVEKAVEERMADDQSTDDVALDHLVAIARRSPEIFLAVNSRGSMSAWALDVASNTTGNTTNDSKIFNIAQIRSQRLESLDGFLQPGKTSHVEIQAYCDRQSGQLHFLLHSFDGRVGVFTTCVADLLDPTENDKRLSLHSIWSGHSASIRKIVRNFSGRAVVSRTRNGETIVWSHALKSHGRPSPTAFSCLLRRSVIPEEGHIHRICLLRQGRFVVFLRETTVSLWDCRSAMGNPLAQCPYEAGGKPLCLIILPRPHPADKSTAHIATVTSERQGIVWEVKLPRYFDDPTATTGAQVQQFCTFQLDVVGSLKYVLPVDPAGSVPVASGFLDVFARDIAISYTHAGRVDLWTARIDLERQSVDWLSTCSTETGLSEPALASGSTLKKVALVNSTRSQLTIWDIGGSRLEFKEDYEMHDSIQDLDWTSTPDSQSILAVGFPYRVVLLSQMRFDYLNKGPAWAPIREINIRDLTPHPIGDSTWLGDGYLVIGAGNQLFIYDRSDTEADSPSTHVRSAHRGNGPWDLFEAVQRYNGPLPVFHPQFLSQCILAGKTTMVRRILVELHRTLKYLIPGESVDNYLGLDLADFYISSTETQRRIHDRANGSFLDQDHHDEDDDIFTEKIAGSVNEKLTKLRIPQLSGQEQIQLVDMIECVAVVEHQRRSMDENGARFILFFRQHALRKGRTNEIQLSWREINWAYHSNSQDILADFVSRQNHGKMLWEHARESGIFMWLTDLKTLRFHFETVARNEYSKSETKNPVECSLFYLALRKKTVLQGLWRMASWNKEQSATSRLLANNFDEPKWRTAALKNAYALLSKRRFEYAAAFFLLAHDLDAAVEVCLRQLQDVQLAIAITRVYEGDNGPVLARLLQDEVLPMAARQGNRWLASWAFWMLGRKDMAVRALVTPVYTLLETPCSPDLKSRLFLTDDPALVVLYAQLRQQTLQTLRGASKVSPRVEWEFVLHSAKLYDRMGCDLLGLDLVRNWEFQSSTMAGIGGEMNPLKLLRRRSSLVVNDLNVSDLHMSVMSKTPMAKHALEATPALHEPSAESLLDSFGF